MGKVTLHQVKHLVFSNLGDLQLRFENGLSLNENKDFKNIEYILIVLEKLTKTPLPPQSLFVWLYISVKYIF